MPLSKTKKTIAKLEREVTKLKREMEDKQAEWSNPLQKSLGQPAQPSAG